MNLTWSNVNATEPKKTNLECSYFPCFLSQVCYRPQGKPYYTAVITAILECGGKCQSKIFKENCFRRDPFFPLKSGHADMTPLPRSISYRADKYEIGTAKFYFVREGCGKSKWKFKMAFAMKGGGSRLPLSYFEK